MDTVIYKEANLAGETYTTEIFKNCGNSVSLRGEISERKQAGKSLTLSHWMGCRDEFGGVS
jgi:hypothetical protein